MKFFMLIVGVLPLAAQTAPTPPPQPTAQPAPPAPIPSPVPTEAPWLTGWIDLGYRWETGVGGSFDTYRTFVNLGSGPKLLGTEFTVADPRHRLFDQFHVRAYNLGDDPYETIHFDAKKAKFYNFNADYRNIALFDYLPSYADPLLSQGIILDEQSFDMRRRFTSFSLDLLPGSWIIPYLAFDRESGSGSGATTFVANGNEFPVPNTLNDMTNMYRGGIRIQLRRFHMTLEEGGTTFVNDQNVYQAPGSENYGNLATPLLGQTLDLSSLLAAYGIRGSSTFSKGLFTANPVSWLDLYGQFLFSQPSTTVNYRQSNTGNLLLQSQVLFYNSQQYLVTAAAKLPRTSGSFGAEVRPFRRLRIVESWLTDRLHDSGSAASTQTLTNATLSEQMSALLTSSMATNYNQAEIDLFFDAASRLTFHGGYRYVWGDASDAILPLEGLAGPEQGHLRRNVGIGGITYRPSQKISLSGEAEGASSGGAYFRTSLYDYQKIRAQARYQVMGSLNLSADFSLLNNRNPLPGVKYDYLAHQVSLSFLWSPQGGKNWDFQGSYSRSTVYSNIDYLEPEILAPAQSLYRDNAHSLTALFSANLPHYSGLTPKILAGGSFFISSGSRPTQYYLPTAKLTLPLSKKFSWFAEWSYYGYGEAFYFYEGFRTHIVTTGLRLTR
ncbi:MAG TPA: hypothetical protein VKV15_21140 [Bryobacteraceae bacterium]|nr:hypothetical protein [Bryobacteraceae bacterium]